MIPLSARLRRLAFVAIVLLLAVGQPAAQTAPQHAPEEVRVLMIGNSLTYANDLPAMLEAMVNSTGTVRLHVESVTAPGASLEDHLQTGAAVRALKNSHWDFVVLQQGPSSLPESRLNLVQESTLFAKYIRAAGATPALFMVWPEEERAYAFDRVRESYLAAAVNVKGKFFPAGEAWRAAWRRKPKLELYGPDRFHPSVEGTYLAALVMAGMLCHCPASRLPSDFHMRTGQTVSIPAADVALLQAAADEAIGSYAKQ